MGFKAYLSGDTSYHSQGRIGRQLVLERNVVMLGSEPKAWKGSRGEHRLVGIDYPPALLSSLPNLCLHPTDVQLPPFGILVLEGLNVSQCFPPDAVQAVESLY